MAESFPGSSKSSSVGFLDSRMGKTGPHRPGGRPRVCLLRDRVSGVEGAQQTGGPRLGWLVGKGLRKGTPGRAVATSASASAGSVVDGGASQLRGPFSRQQGQSRSGPSSVGRICAPEEGEPSATREGAGSSRHSSSCPAASSNETNKRKRLSAAAPTDRVLTKGRVVVRWSARGSGRFEGSIK